MCCFLWYLQFSWFTSCIIFFFIRLKTKKYFDRFFRYKLNINMLRRCSISRGGRGDGGGGELTALLTCKRLWKYPEGETECGVRGAHIFRRRSRPPFLFAEWEKTRYTTMKSPFCHSTCQLSLPSTKVSRCATAFLPSSSDLTICSPAITTNNYSRQHLYTHAFNLDNYTVFRLFLSPSICLIFVFFVR